MAASLAYAYKGRDAQGKNVRGRIDAPSEASAATRLKAMGVAATSIAEAREGTGLNTEIKMLTRGVGLKDLSVMSRQMATMISSGLSLLRTLTILSQQTESRALAKILTELTRDVESGVSLSDAMYRHAESFPPIMINLVRAGEVGGFLDGALETIAKNFEAESKLRGTIKAALTYPVVVLVMAIVGVFAMLIFIVPVFKDLFAGLGGTLPLPTQILVTMSESMIFVVPIILVAGTFGYAWWRKNKHTIAVRRVVDPIRFRLPVFGPLAIKLSIARFTRNFSSMIGAGVPILQALHIVGETAGNWVIENALNNVAESVRQGNSIAEPLAMEKVFPAMVTQMIAVGEDAGALETMLEKIADFYDHEVQAATEQLTAMIEPLMVAFLGIVVGGMIVCLYLPIFNIFTLIK